MAATLIPIQPRFPMTMHICRPPSIVVRFVFFTFVVNAALEPVFGAQVRGVVGQSHAEGAAGAHRVQLGHVGRGQLVAGAQAMKGTR